MGRYQRTGKLEYKIKRLHHSSARYGCCEVCAGDVDTAYLQTSFEFIIRPDGSRFKIPLGGGALFGHKSCLELQRRPS